MSLSNKRTLFTSNLLISIGLIIGMLLSYDELRSALSVPQNWEQLLSGAGVIAVVLYSILLLAGLLHLFSEGRVVSGEAPAARDADRSPLLFWIIAGILLLLTSWIYLFSPWQTILAAPWSQLLFSAGVAKLIQRYAAPRQPRGFGWRELALTVTIFLYPRIVNEMRVLFSAPLVYRGATVTGFLFTLVLAFLFYDPAGDRLRDRLIRLRERIRGQRWLVVLLWLVPWIYLSLAGADTYIQYPNIRFAWLLVALWVAAFLTTESQSLVSRDALGLNFGALILGSAIVRSLLFVVDYPFSLSWSEGNRFYDYSLMFGQSLYNHEGYIFNPYSSPGRYGLWGVLFLWQGLPIWIHRLWNILLQTIPVLVFSALITRTLTPRVLRYGMALWIALFLLVLAPLHPPFIVVSIIVAAFAFHESPVVRGISLALASAYAGASRLTWVFVPAALGGLIDLLLFYPKRNGSLLRRLTPTALLIVAGLLPGLIPTMQGYLSLVQGESLTSSQPLLWYRLLPNSTLGPGVLFLTLRYTLPLLILLAWWMISRRWQLDWIQQTAIWAVLTGFFAVGLVISTKIGGGGDLHNLDMFLVTLLTLVVLGLMSFRAADRWPVWAVGLVLYSIFWVVYPFLPLHPGSNYHPRLELPSENKVSEAFSTVREEVTTYANSGPVLFMDHRQLLTFGFLPAVPFSPEYEKKYMMDQAMGNNASYFESYYHDLAEKRFALIVTEPLRTRRREDLGGPFSEENDAWVLWVSNPTLCFYEPIYLSTDVNLQLLVPRQNPTGCEEYLE